MQVELFILTESITAMYKSICIHPVVGSTNVNNFHKKNIIWNIIVTRCRYLKKTWNDDHQL